MSANLDLVRSIYADWARGALADNKFDPEISMSESSALPGGGASAEGIDAVRAYIASFANYWEEIRFEPQEYLEAGDRVVVVARLWDAARKAVSTCLAIGPTFGPCVAARRCEWTGTRPVMKPSRLPDSPRERAGRPRARREADARCE